MQLAPQSLLDRIAAGESAFPGLELSAASFLNARFRQLQLRGAQWARLDLRGAVLEGANLRGADLRGADLTGATSRWPW